MSEETKEAIDEQKLEQEAAEVLKEDATEYVVTSEKHLKTASVLGIISAILSAASFLLMVIFTVFVAMETQNILNGTSDYTITWNPEAIAEVARLTAGMGVTEAEAIAGLYAMTAMFIGFGAILSLVMVMSSLRLALVRKRLDKIYATFIIGVIGCVVALITFQIIHFILLLIATILVHKDYVVRDENANAESNRMGFMRAIEILTLLNLVGRVLTLVFFMRSGDYDVSYWLSFVQIIMSAVVLWILWNKKSHGREICIAIIAIAIVLQTIGGIISGLTPTDMFVDYIWPVVMLIYFIFAQRPKRVLTQPWRRNEMEKARLEDSELWRPKDPIFWRNLLLYFCIFSVVGHWMEWGVCWLIRWGIVPGEYDPNSGIWHDMLNPFFVYGAAVVFIGLLLFPIKNWLQKKTPNIVVAIILSFIVNTLFCAIIELAMGLVLNTPPDPVTGHLPLWDYNNMAFNFMGQICLLNTSFFGVMATLITWLVYPNMERAFRRIPHDIMNVVSVVVVVFFILVVCMYVINITLA